MRVFKQPCYREPLSNVVPFRLSEGLLPCQRYFSADDSKGNAGLGQLRATYPKVQWSGEDLEVKKVSLVQHLFSCPDENAPIITYKLRKFIPGPRDSIDLEWNSHGLIKRQKMPAYAIVSNGPSSKLDSLIAGPSMI